MLEILGLVIAVTAIAAVARGRGASPVLTGVITVVGYVLLKFGSVLALPRGDNRAFIALVSGWIWVALVFGYVRFVVGARLPKPDSKWNCSNCRYLNESSSVICEACQQPWKAERVLPESPWKRDNDSIYCLSSCVLSWLPRGVQG